MEFNLKIHRRINLIKVINCSPMKDLFISTRKHPLILKLNLILRDVFSGKLFSKAERYLLSIDLTIQ